MTSGEQRKPAGRCTSPLNGCETIDFVAFAGLVELLI